MDQMPRQRMEDERKRSILAAATRCFVRQGYGQTRLVDIAREAGLSKGGVYFHYRAKEDLFRDLVEAHLEAVRARWGFIPVADEPADRTLSQILRAQLRTMEHEPDETRLGHLLVTLAPREPEFRAKLRQVDEAMRALYESVIDRGIREGVFHRVPAAHLATAVLALVQGLARATALDLHGRLPLPPEEAIERILGMLRRTPQLSADRTYAPGTRRPN